MATPLSISETLGYYEVIMTQYPISLSRMEFIDAAFLKLVDVDVALASIVTDGMTEQVGDMKLNYGKHVAMLKLEGTRLLSAISAYSGIPIRFNKYTGALNEQLTSAGSYPYLTAQSQGHRRYNIHSDF